MYRVTAFAVVVVHTCTEYRFLQVLWVHGPYGHYSGMCECRLGGALYVCFVQAILSSCFGEVVYGSRTHYHCSFLRSEIVCRVSLEYYVRANTHHLL